MKSSLKIFFVIFVVLINNVYASNHLFHLRYTSQAVATLPRNVVDKPSACAGFFIMSKYRRAANKDILADIAQKKANYKPYQDKGLSYFIKTQETPQTPQIKQFKKRSERQTSAGERVVADWLVKNNIRFKREKEFSDLINPNTGKPLSIDFYLHSHRICIEFDGRQHFKASKLFDRNGDSVEARTQRDRIKDTYCINKGIKMIRIRYSDINRVSEILTPHFLI